MLPNYIHHLPGGSHFWHAIRLQFMRCVLVWDGFQFPPPQTARNVTSELSDFSGTISTFQYPGYNGFHALELEHYPEGDLERTYFVWCGTQPDMAQELGPKQGARITLKSLPTELDGIFDLLLSPDFVALVLPVMDPIIQNFPVDMHRVYQMPFIIDKLATNEKYVRKEFIIMQAFEPTAWAAIFVSMLLLGIIATLVLRFANHIQDPESCPIPDTALKWTRDIWTMTYQMFGLLLAEPPNTTALLPARYRYKSVWGQWLLASTLLATMLSGSMRDLMSMALVLYVPEAIQEICTNRDFADYKLFASDVVDVESNRNPEVMRCLEQLKKSTNPERFLTFPMSTLLTEGFNGVAKMMDIIYTEIDHLALVIGERDLLITIYLVDVYWTELSHALARVRSTSVSDGNTVLERFADTASNLDNRDKIHFGGDGRSVSLYYPLSKTIPAELLSVWLHGTCQFRENGIMYRVLEWGDERIKARLLRKEPPPRCQILKVSDLLGGLAIYAVITLIGRIILIPERIAGAKKASKKLKPKRRTYQIPRRPQNLRTTPSRLPPPPRTSCSGNLFVRPSARMP